MNLFFFWEDLMIVPQKFEKNYKLIFGITKKILEMRTEIELICSKCLNTKLIKIFLSFIKMAGFPEAEFKKSLVKILIVNEAKLEKNHISIKIQSTLIQSRKTAVMIVSASKENMSAIQYVSSTIQEVTGFHASDLRGQSIHKLMPYCYNKVHDKMMENFLVTADQHIGKSRNIVTHVNNPFDFIQKVAIFVKIYPFCDNQIKMVF